MTATMYSTNTGCELYAGYNNHKPGSTWVGHHSNWNIVFIIRGSATVSIGDKSLHLEKHSLTLIAPGSSRVFTATEKLNVFWVHFNMDSGIDFKAEWNTVAPNIQKLKIKHSDKSKIQKIFANVIHLARYREVGWYRLAYCRIQEIILRGNMINKKGLDEAHIKLSSQLLSSLNTMYTIDELAKRCGMSRAVFFRKFKETFGVTPNAYREQLTMRKVQELLEDSNMTLSQIAESLNICNEFYLSTRFKKVYGVSPKQYRKQFLKTE